MKNRAAGEEKIGLSASILIGRSKRMGRDKAKLKIGQQTFLGHIIQELSICDEVFLSSAVNNDYSEYGLDVIMDEKPDSGPMEGIRRSLYHAAYDDVFICAYDMPFFRREMVPFLKDRKDPGHDIVVFRDAERVHPLCGIYGRSVLPVIERFLSEGRRRMMDLLDSVSTKYVDIADGGFPGDVLRNVNTPEEYREVSSIAGSQGVNPLN